MAMVGMGDLNDYIREAGIAALRDKGGAKYTEEQVLKAVYESGLHQYAPGVIRTSWKDGIDIDIPHSSLMSFVRKLTENA
jgi:hypothetical protein